MSFTKYNSVDGEDAQIETVEVPEAPVEEDPKPEERPYAYDESSLPAAKRPY